MAARTLYPEQETRESFFRESKRTIEKTSDDDTSGNLVPDHHALKPINSVSLGHHTKFLTHEWIFEKSLHYEKHIKQKNSEETEAMQETDGKNHRALKYYIHETRRGFSWKERMRTLEN